MKTGIQEADISENLDDVVACHLCDLLVRVDKLRPGTKADCPRCGHTLCFCPKGGLQRPLALSIAAIIFLILSNLFPFMSFSAGGQAQVMTLIEGSLALHNNDNSVIAFILLGCTVAVPGLILLVITFLLIELLLLKKASPSFPFRAKLIFSIQPWAMADVFLVGVLVSLIKIASLATVEMGLSFWVFFVFTILFTWTLGSLDKHMIWDKWERNLNA
ncbi:MAG: paraquat-inducible protein A [Verrucomicrobiota bacterium]